MSSQHAADHHQGATMHVSASAPPVWWIVLKQELTDLWVGGRVYVLLILFSFVMSVTAFLNEAESQLSLIPPKEMVFLTLLGSLSFGLLIGLILGADSVSGERERATLEALLLTPASRRQIIAGKFLAALSPWPVALLLSVPYMAVFARGHAVFGQAILVGGLLGTILAVAFTGFGMLTSIWSKSNKVSLLISLLVYVILLIPTQFPGSAQKGDLGYFVQQLNPLQATSEFLEKYLVNNRSWAERPAYLYATALSAAVILALLFFYAAPRLDHEGGLPRLVPPKKARAANVLAGAGIMVLLSLPLALAVRPAFAQSVGPDLKIAVDLDYKTVNAGDELTFNSVVTNTGTEKSPPLNVAMNIVKTGKGDPVDPEDWSPQRTQSIETLGPGESVKQSWTVQAILEGDIMVYLTVIPKPRGPDATSQLVSSSGVHVTVYPFAEANPGGVLPIAIGIPIALMAFSILLRRSKRWRRETTADAL
jgi:ABC-2 type transport system permease protein